MLLNTESRRVKREWVQTAVFLAIWPGVNLLIVTAVQIDLGFLTLARFKSAAITIWLIFASAFMLVWAATRWLPSSVKREHFSVQLGIHFFAIFLSAQLFGPPLEQPSSLQAPEVLVIPVVMLLLEIVIYLGLIYILDEQERSYETRLVLQQAELNALQAQSNPHFLFNTLNLITSEISTDPENAKEIVYDLADLLRSNIKMAQQRFSTVVDEITIIRLYLRLQEKRFKDRFTFEVDVSDEANSLFIPSLLLLPVVENAIKHAVAPYASSAKVSIHVAVEAQQLSILVKDTGPVFDHRNIQDGNGLTILRKTLALQYPNNHKVALRSTDSGGELLIQLPAQSRVPSVERIY